MFKYNTAFLFGKMSFIVAGFSLQSRDVEAVEYFLLPLPAPYKVYFRFELLSSKCFHFQKNLTAFTSLPHVL